MPAFSEELISNQSDNKEHNIIDVRKITQIDSGEPRSIAMSWHWFAVEVDFCDEVKSFILFIQIPQEFRHEEVEQQISNRDPCSIPPSETQIFLWNPLRCTKSLCDVWTSNGNGVDGSAHKCCGTNCKSVTITRSMSRSC